MEWNLSPTFNGRASAAIGPGLRVKRSATAGYWELAGDEACAGVTYNRAYAAGDPLTVIDIRCTGLLPFVASGAISAGARFTSAANGKVASGTGGNEDYGYAETAATGDGAEFSGASKIGL